MPKKHSLNLNIDLLKPQTKPQKLIFNLIKWALSAGRYLIIFVEIIVLAAFLMRFKLDTDIADNKDAINQQLPFIKALQGDESLIRQTQFQLTSLKDLRTKQYNYNQILDKIAAQTPSGVVIGNLELNLSGSNLAMKMTGTAQNNDQVSSLLFGLKTDGGFTDASLASVSLSQGLINFSITGSTGGH